MIWGRSSSFDWVVIDVGCLVDDGMHNFNTIF